MNLIFQKNPYGDDGVDLSTLGLHRIRHTIPTAEIAHTTTEIDGIEGLSTIESKRTARTITVEFVLQADSIEDYDMKRNMVSNLLGRTDSYYIQFKREPERYWYVRTKGSITIPPHSSLSLFTVTFECVRLYSEGKRFSTKVIESYNLLGEAQPVGFIENNGSEDIVPFRDNIEIIIEGQPTAGASSIEVYTSKDAFRYDFSIDPNYDPYLTEEGTIHLYFTNESIENYGLSVLRYTNKSMFGIPSYGTEIWCRNFEWIRITVGFTEQYK